jgi:hypothetical protein
MRFTFTEEQNRFRQEVRDFLQAEIKAGTFVAKSGGLAEGNSKTSPRKWPSGAGSE